MHMIAKYAAESDVCPSMQVANMAGDPERRSRNAQDTISKASNPDTMKAALGGAMDVDAKITVYVALACVVAASGGVLFGYDAGNMASHIGCFPSTLPPVRLLLLACASKILSQADAPDDAGPSREVRHSEGTVSHVCRRDLRYDRTLTRSLPSWVFTVFQDRKTERGFLAQGVPVVWRLCNNLLRCGKHSNNIHGPVKANYIW